MAKRGRPTKLTPEVQATIVNALAAGTYLETAAAAAGINQDTLHRWLRKGARSEGGIQKVFSEAVKKALASAEIGFSATISLASRNQWQAAAWMLERRYPDRWARLERQEITGEGGKPILLKVLYLDAREHPVLVPPPAQFAALPAAGRPREDIIVVDAEARKNGKRAH